MCLGCFDIHQNNPSGMEENVAPFRLRRHLREGRYHGQSTARNSNMNSRGVSIPLLELEHRVDCSVRSLAVRLPIPCGRPPADQRMEERTGEDELKIKIDKKKETGTWEPPKITEKKKTT